MVYRTVICVLLVGVVVGVGAALGCGEGGETEQAQYSTAGTGIGAPAPFRGATSLEERIADHPTVVKARLSSVSAEAVAGAERNQGHFFVVLKFNLSVSEYLKGSGGNDITAMRVVFEKFNTRKKAEDAIPGIRDNRDTQWDDREAIFFLYDVREDTFPSLRDEDHFFIGHPHTLDNYSIASTLEKAWLPAASSSSGTTGDSQEFLLDVPSQPGSTTPTITLGNLKQRIAEVTSELNDGDGSEAYKECIRHKYLGQRIDSYKQSTGRPGYGSHRVPTQHEFGSGQPADTVLFKDHLGGAYSAQEKATLRVDGRDSALFSVSFGDLVPHEDSDGDGQTDIYTFEQSVVVLRPLPAGEYRFNRHFTPLSFLACNHTLTDELTVTVTSPASTLHELFFDPVNQSGAVKADASNGVLKPAAFTDANGASATVESISYEAGTVEVEVTPDNALAGQIVDFIELDGSVSLSLDVGDATVVAATGSGQVGTLSWSVSSQPWEEGDMLMVRIREAR